MRTVFTFFALIFVLGAGCTQTASVQNQGTEQSSAITPHATDSPEPLVIPLEPRVRTPRSDENADKEPATPETTGFTAKTIGKYAAEAVPLPPINDLTAQVDDYIARLGLNLESLERTSNYAEDAVDIVRDANALSLVALAIGLAEVDSKYKISAPHIIAAAQNLAAAQTLADSAKALEALKASLTDTSQGNPLSWSSRVADLVPLMRNAVPNLSSTVKRLTNTERAMTLTLERRPQQIYGSLAALAVISQGSIANVSETLKPDAVEEWKRLCEEFRDTALRANALAHQFASRQADFSVFRTAIDAMSVSCDDCHKVFYPDAIGKE